MFRQVLVGIDEETRGADALALASRLMNRDAELIRVHVPCPSSVGAGLHRAAEAAGADLTVVGSARQGRRGRVFLGDLISHALDGAPCAVAIAPRGYADDPVEIADIGVAFNGSPESVHAVVVARLLATERGARLSAFETVEVRPYAASTGAYGTFGDSQHEHVLAARGRICALGDDVDAYATAGDPVRQLAIFSDSVDLLVAGSRGYGPVGRFVPGSTTRKLVKVTRCPLLIPGKSSGSVVDGASGPRLTESCGFPAAPRRIAAADRRFSAEDHDPPSGDHACVKPNDSNLQHQRGVSHVTQSL